MQTNQKIAPCLWFDNQAETAAAFYTSVFNEAVSLQIFCETQEEIDYYWNRLSEGGDKKAQQCGWLKDKFGLSWQVVPTVLPQMLQDKDPEKSQRVMKALLQMH